MNNFNKVVRILLGLVIIVSGANKFTHWINVSFMHDALNFIVDLTNIGGGFIITGIALIEISLGVLLVVDRFSTFAALALLPLMVAILFFHIVLDLNGILIALVVFSMDVYILIANRERITPLFS